MLPRDTYRDFLAGLLALENRMASRPQLAEAFTAWARDETRSIAEVLVEQGVIDDERRAQLETLVGARLGLPDGDPTKVLATLAVGAATRRPSGDPEETERTATLAGTALPSTLEGDGPASAGSAGLAAPGGRRFRILRPLAQGGLGAVSVALDAELNREVALKQILEHHADNPASRSRFLLEAEITGGLEHPGIVPVYGLGRDGDGRPYYAMRFIRGESLKQAIADFHDDEAPARDPGARSLALRKLLRRFTDACNAIEYAHGRGVLHRDIKPGNIIVGRHGETLVVDWGLAKTSARPEAAGDAEEPTLMPSSASGSAETLPGSAMGTPAYMSPEQAAGDLERLGARSDVYGLGATLYTILTGRPPFGGDHVGKVLMMVQKGQFPPPRRVDPAIDPALEAVCLKAMATRPEDRYPSCRPMVEDVERWMADEPVSAWREPVSRRAGRWARRHRVLVTSSAAAAMVGLAAAGYAFYGARLREGRRLAAALGRVEALITAEAGALPQLVEQLAPDRHLVRGRLVELARGEGPGADDRRRMPAALALLQDDPAQSALLARRARDPATPPAEVLVIARQLARVEGDPGLVQDLRRELGPAPSAMTDGQLRAAGLMAWLAPGDADWPKLAAPLAAKLTAENTLLINGWAELFRPVSRPLVAPLREIYAGRADAAARERAYAMLLDFADRPDNPARAEDLAALMAEADPGGQGRLFDRLATRDARDRAAAELARRLAAPRKPFDDVDAGRRARTLAALARLGRPDPAWAAFALGEDPATRTELIHELPRHLPDPRAIVDRLGREPDASTRRAQILCLGEFPPDALPAADREAASARLLGSFRTDPDPGVHGAIDWLLRRRWGLGGPLDAIDAELASPAVPPDRGWFVNGQRQSFSVVRGPVEFRMGSTPESDPDRVAGEEARHRRRIPRSFAVGAREVTVADYVPFLDARLPGVVDRRDDPQYGQYLPGPASATGLVNWYEAARYCNWLSEREKIPRDQWCYPEEIGPGMALAPDHLNRTGYRLPTDAEWEYACRAGTTSSRFYGRSEPRLKEYAWHGGSEEGGRSPIGRLMSPVGLLKPNDLGLFDMLGNALEWCDGPFLPHPQDGGAQVADDLPAGPDRPATSRRILRGGTYIFPAPLVRSASRIAEEPTSSALVGGFRVARTLP